MPRTVAPINGCRITAVPSPSFVGSNIVQTASYRVCWVMVTTVNGKQQVSFSDAPTAPPFQQGSGSVTVTEPNTTSALAIQQAVVAAVAAAEGLSTGDIIVLPSGTDVITL